MAESTRDAKKRANKRSKMRESLNSAFDDPLQSFQTPKSVRQMSEKIDHESAQLEGRIRHISDSSNEPIGDGPGKTSFFIHQRQELVEDIEAHLKEARRIVREAYTEQSSHSQRKELKRALTELEKTDDVLLRERTALAADRVRVKYSILSHPSNTKIGEAYMMAITQNLSEPAGALYKKKHGRESSDQTSFRNRIIKSYNPKGSEILETDNLSRKIWCPVSGKYFPGSAMKAAHIIPYSIGEINAAYLFGTKLDEGYDVIWSERNGLMMNTDFEKLFDDGRMVIMPDPIDNNEFISIILSQELLKNNTSVAVIDAPISTIHRRQLQFQTSARPGKRYLYMHALLSLFHRRRYNVPGWEKDREQVFNGQIWATPKKWARRSMLEALAIEVGDSWEGIESIEGLGEFPDTKPPEEEKKMATVMRYAVEAQASDMEDE